MGQTYISPTRDSPVGDFSFHFDEERPYIDVSNNGESKKFKNGTHPGKIYFTDFKVYLEEDVRRFSGRISYDRGGGWYENKDSDFWISFDKDFVNIERSE